MGVYHVIAAFGGRWPGVAFLILALSGKLALGPIAPGTRPSKAAATADRNFPPRHPCLLPSCGPSSGPSTHQDMYSFHNGYEQDQASWSRECSRSILPGAAMPTIIAIGRTCSLVQPRSLHPQKPMALRCSQLPMSPITCPIPSPTVPVSCCCRYCYSIVL
jgi:hypothetical protein